MEHRGGVATMDPRCQYPAHTEDRYVEDSEREGEDEGGPLPSEMGLHEYMRNYTNPRMSMTFSSSKGLLNAPGQNNCFLNSAVQVLFHLDVFRRNFRQLSGHLCMGNSCIFCALKVIFNQFQHSDESVLPADGLRKAMAETFADQQKFQLGFMDDAAECFENIMLRIHTHSTGNENEDACTAKHCIPHQKFTMSIMEQVRCSCGKASEPLVFDEMVYYVSTTALVEKHKTELGTGRTTSDLTFGTLVRETVASGDERSCPNNCGANSDKKRNLMNCPDVVSIGLVWDSQKSTAAHIKDVVRCIDTSLRLPELFHSTVDERCRWSPALRLVGVVCYYGKHYSTFFYHSKIEEWIYLDDATVSQVGASWTQVADKLCKGRYQPLLLLYANPDFKKISTESAPKATTMVEGSEWSEGPMAELVAKCNSYNLELKMRKGSKRQNRSSKQSVFSYSSSESARGSTSGDRGKPSGDLVRKQSFLSAMNGGEPRRTGGYRGEGGAPSSGSSVHRRQSNASESSSLSSMSNPPDPDSDEMSRQTSSNRERNSASRYRKSGAGGKPDVWRYQSDVSAQSCEDALDLHTGNRDRNLGDGMGTTSSSEGSSVANYATLPRKKKNLGNIPTSPSDRNKHTNWMADIARKGEEMQNQRNCKVESTNGHGVSNEWSSPSNGSHHRLTPDSGKGNIVAPLDRQTSAPGGSAQRKIDFYSRGSFKSAGETENRFPPPPSDYQLNKQSPASNGGVKGVDSTDGGSGTGNYSVIPGLGSKPRTVSDPYIKPSLLYGASESDTATYIKRSSVEKILNQQRRTSRGAMSTGQPIGAPRMVKPSHDLNMVSLQEQMDNSADMSRGLQLDIPPDNASISSLKDSGYRSAGDRNSTTSASSVSSMSIESSPTIREAFHFDRSRAVNAPAGFDSPSEDGRSSLVSSESGVSVGLNSLNGTLTESCHSVPAYTQLGESSMFDSSHSKQHSHASSASEATLKGGGGRDSSTDSLNSLHSSHTLVKGIGAGDSSMSAPSRSLADRMRQLSVNSMGSFEKSMGFPRQSADPVITTVQSSKPKQMVKSILKTVRPLAQTSQEFKSTPNLRDPSYHSSQRSLGGDSADDGGLPQFIPPPLEYANENPESSATASNKRVPHPIASSHSMGNLGRETIQQNYNNNAVSPTSSRGLNREDDYCYFGPAGEEDEEEEDDEDDVDYHDYMNLNDISKSSPFDDRCLPHSRQKSDESIQLYGTLPRNKRQQSQIGGSSSGAVSLNSKGLTQLPKVVNGHASSNSGEWPAPPPSAYTGLGEGPDDGRQQKPSTQLQQQQRKWSQNQLPQQQSRWQQQQRQPQQSQNLQRTNNYESSRTQLQDDSTRTTRNVATVLGGQGQSTTFSAAAPSSPQQAGRQPNQLPTYAGHQQSSASTQRINPQPSHDTGTSPHTSNSRLQTTQNQNLQQMNGSNSQQSFYGSRQQNSNPESQLPSSSATSGSYNRQISAPVTSGFNSTFQYSKTASPRQSEPPSQHSGYKPHQNAYQQQQNNQQPQQQQPNHQQSHKQPQQQVLGLQQQQGSRQSPEDGEMNAHSFFDAKSGGSAPIKPAPMYNANKHQGVYQQRQSTHQSQQHQQQPQQNQQQARQPQQQPYQQKDGFYEAYGPGGVSALPPKQGVTQSSGSERQHNPPGNKNYSSQNSQPSSQQPPLWNPTAQPTSAYLQGHSHYDRPSAATDARSPSQPLRSPSLTGGVVPPPYSSSNSSLQSDSSRSHWNQQGIKTQSLSNGPTSYEANSAPQGYSNQAGARPSSQQRSGYYR